MNQKAVRIKVRCESCRATAFLTPEHYRTLVKGSQLALLCPHCAHQFVFSPTGFRARKAAALARKSPAEVVRDSDPVPLSPPAPARVSAPAFPPPPFAPLGVGAATPVSARAPAPPFAPMGGGPSAPAPAAPPPQRAEVPTGSEPKQLTVNQHWKRLPQWQQWVVVSLTVVAFAIVIFAVPVGGSGSGAPETAAPKAADTRPAKSGSDRPTDNKQSPKARQP
jgi:hypothetical protein